MKIRPTELNTSVLNLSTLPTSDLREENNYVLLSTHLGSLTAALYIWLTGDNFTRGKHSAEK